MIKKLTLALTLAAAIAAVQNASATTDTYYISGNSCHSATPGLTPIYNPQWGPKAPGTAMDVICPITLPHKQYTTLSLTLAGYNRQTNDFLSCDVSSTTYSGEVFHTKRFTLSKNQNPIQTISGSMNLTNFEYFISIKCHLPAGENYLTSLQVSPWY